MELTSPAAAFEIYLIGCLSGYTATIDESQVTGLKVYTYDRNCYVGLNYFQFQGRNYFPTATDPFTTWQPGDTATYDEPGEPGNFPMTVTIQSNLSNPVSESDLVAFAATALVDGPERSLMQAIKGPSGSIQHKTNLPPSFTLKRIDFLGLNVQKAGRYRFYLECTVMMTVANVCTGVNLSVIDYKFVADTFNNSPSKGQANGVFSTNGTPIAIPGEVVSPGSSGLTNGGFMITEIAGPANLHLTPNLMLILRSYAASYQYFNVDVTVNGSY
jgi:hypothetical protein